MGALARFFGFSSSKGKTKEEYIQAKNELKAAKSGFRYTAKWVQAKGETLILNAKTDALLRLLEVAESEASGINEGISKALPEYKQSARQKGMQINKIRAMITNGKKR
jgi:hypothetical protein